MAIGDVECLAESGQWSALWVVERPPFTGQVQFWAHQYGDKSEMTIWIPVDTQVDAPGASNVR